jgi:hypothetical protein
MMSFMMSKAGRGQYLQRYRDGIARQVGRNPNGVLGKMLENFDKRFGTAPQTAAPTPSPAGQADPAGGMGSGPLSPNDPRSLTDPRTRSNVSKTLLGQ